MSEFHEIYTKLSIHQKSEMLWHFTSEKFQSLYRLVFRPNKKFVTCHQTKRYCNEVRAVKVCNV